VKPAEKRLKKKAKKKKTTRKHRSTAEKEGGSREHSRVWKDSKRVGRKKKPGPTKN